MRPRSAAVLLAVSLAFPLTAQQPEVARELPVTGARASVQILSDDRPFGSVALTWRADEDLVPLVRVSADRAVWSDWIRLSLDDDSTERSEGRYVTGIVHLPFDGLEIEVRLGDGAHALKAVVFPPSRRSGPRAVTERYQLGALQIRSREEWGCPDGEASRWTPAYTTVTHAIVHHTAGSNSITDYDAEMRSIWYLHTITNGWGDIGYNFLIDPKGVIYEGRAGGDRAIGAHFSCRNTNTVGVSMLGTYTSTPPTAAAMNSLGLLLRELCRRFGLDPLAVVHHNPSDLDLPVIATHRDGNSSKLTCTVTTRPGDALYALPSVRAAAVNPPQEQYSPPKRRAVRP